MKKSVLIVILVLVLGAGGGIGLWYLLSGGFGEETEEQKIFVEPVASIISANRGMKNRFIGVVESQEIKSINKDNDKKIKEILAAEGDQIQKGTPLFSYDTEDMKLNLQQGNLEIERMSNNITSMKNQIAQLEKEKAKVKGEEQLSYTVQIQGLETDISKEEYNINVKNLELVQIQKDIDNSTINSDIDGVIQKINPNATGGEGDSAFITILPIGEMLVKGTVNEMNLSSLTQGQAVTVRSRMDEEQVWKGVISKIDTERTQSNNESNAVAVNGMGDSNAGANSSSKYSFYIEMAEGSQLVLGQHVLIEPDQGEEDLSIVRLPEDYIVQEDQENPYVWLGNDQNVIEKRPVALGTYDEKQKTYEIIEGVANSDYVAYPFNYIKEKMPVLKDGEESTEQTGESGSGETFDTDENIPSGSVDGTDYLNQTLDETLQGETETSQTETSQTEPSGETALPESSSSDETTSSAETTPSETSSITAEQTLPPVNSNDSGKQTITPLQPNAAPTTTHQTRPYQTPPAADPVPNIVGAEGKGAVEG